ncbi:MAG TPA: hypothetical protein PLB21_09150 [Actinomycetota bacterium]|nr:hypothetical protein [Actinomycetota bacterium]
MLECIFVPKLSGLPEAALAGFGLVVGGCTPGELVESSGAGSTASLVATPHPASSSDAAIPALRVATPGLTIRRAYLFTWRLLIRSLLADAAAPEFIAQVRSWTPASRTVVAASGVVEIGLAVALAPWHGGAWRWAG